MSNCPYCNNENTAVKDSRPFIYRDTIVTYRRRLCYKCQNRFSTYELPESLLKIAENSSLTRQLGRVKLLMNEIAELLINEGK